LSIISYHLLPARSSALGLTNNEEKFTSRNLKRKSFKYRDLDVVSNSDTFTENILGNRVTATRSHLLDFIKTYEQKLAEYLDNPFLTILTDGVLSRNLKNFKAYVVGACICLHYGFPAKRFIEVQFYYHDIWKKTAPSVQYVTSLLSDWNSVGRYRQYCATFENELDYFSEGVDNVNVALQDKQSTSVIETPSSSLVLIYEEMISFQMEATKLLRKSVLKLLGYPGKERIPFRYLRTLPLYLELIAEDAWGESVKELSSYQKLKAEIENTKHA